MHSVLHASGIDYAIMALYGLFVIAIGWMTSRTTKSSEDFFLSGRDIPAWIAGLAFMSANLGALEVLGMAAQGAQYGMMTAHFYWIGAIPAMVFLGVAMMPFYYGSKVRSVPEYLQKRYNEGTRFINAVTFAVSTLVLSGVNMYAMGLVFHDLIGWNLTGSIWVSAVVVLLYTTLGGLKSSIYNEVLQFFLIVFGLVPLTVIGLIANGGWSGLVAKLPKEHLHTWADTGSAAGNPMHITWPGIVLGLGFVLSFGYWCTDFLVVQRALAAKNMNAAQRTPIIAAFPKLVFPFFVILPGLLALALIPGLGTKGDPTLSYNNALPLMMAKYYPSGLLGLGLTALLASFMSGMAGNVTAFNTVFTYDLYSAYMVKGKSDRHYLMVGRVTTVVGVVVSVFFAYVAEKSPSIMDFTQLVFGFVNAPLLATFLLGMFSKRTTAWGGFWGLIVGIAAAAAHWQMTRAGMMHFDSDQAGNFWRAVVAFAASAVVTWGVSMMGKAPDEKGLVGLVYQLTPVPQHGHEAWFRRPAVLGIVVLAATVVMNLLFW